jgi:hypothetical protein
LSLQSLNRFFVPLACIFKTAQRPSLQSGATQRNATQRNAFCDPLPPLAVVLPAASKAHSVK